MKTRRFWITSAAAGLAGVAGVAAWYTKDAASPQLEALPEPFWALRFEKPQGGELVLSELRGQPLLVNFWATWCPPCLQELPDLQRFQQAYRSKGWRVVGIAIDSPSAVRQFLQRMPLDFDIGMGGLQGTELTRSLGNSAGSLPFTVIINRAGQISQRKLGVTHFEEITAWAAMPGH